MEATNVQLPVRQSGSYVVLLASFMALFFNAGMGYSVGVFHVALLDTFEADPNLTVWVGSTFMCMFALAGPVASIIINLTNCRTCVIVSGVLGLIGFSANFFVQDIKWMFVTYTSLAGISTGLAYTGGVVVLGYHFKERLSVITGIGICGIALGNFVHPPVCQILIDYYGLRGAFLIIGAIVFNACVCGMLMTPSQFEKERHVKITSGRPRRQTTLTMFCRCKCVREIMTNKSYLFFLLGCGTFGMAISILLIYIPDYLQYRGITSQASAFSVSFSGIGSIVSRVLSGVAAHDKKIGNTLMFTSLNGLMGIVSLLTPLFTTSSLAAYIYGFLIGLYSGGIWGLICPLTVDVLDIDMMATGFGVAMFVCGVGLMIGSPFAGYIFEASGDYFDAFVFSAGMFFTCALCMVFSTMFRVSGKGSPQTTRRIPSDITDLREIERIVKIENGSPDIPL